MRQARRGWQAVPGGRSISLRRDHGKATIDAPGVGRASPPAGFALQFGAGRVIGADAVPGGALARETLAEDPRPDHEIHAGIEQLLAVNAIGFELWQPARVDLHQSDIGGAGARPVAQVLRTRVE